MLTISFLSPDPQQFFHSFPALVGQLFVPLGIAKGQAVAAFFHTVYCLLAGGVQPLFQRVLGHGGDDDHGDVLAVAGLHDLFQVDVEKIAAGLTAKIIEYQKVVVSAGLQQPFFAGQT